MKNSVFSNFRDYISYLFFLCVIFPLKIMGIKNASNICGKIVSFFGPFSRSNKIVTRNLNYVFSDLTPSQSKLLQQKIWENFGKYIGEFAYIDAALLDNHNEVIKIEIPQRTKNLIASEEKIIIFSAHMANWEIALTALGKVIGKLAVIYRKINNKYIDDYVKAKRVPLGTSLICKGPEGRKELIAALKNQQNLVMLIDQKMNEGIEVPLLGKNAKTSHSIASFCRDHGYKAIPAQIIRLSDKEPKFILKLEDPISFEFSDNKDKDLENFTLIINQIIGRWVLEHPDQWFWMHQRWGKETEMQDYSPKINFPSKFESQG